jgi:hypothetical protein
MASTYSSRLRLELQTTGENRSTWGTKANNVFSRIEDSVAGSASVDMSDGNYSLTTNNGTEDEARKAIIIIGGTNTATRTLTIPAVSKTYFIYNNSGQSVIVSNGSDTVTLANGDQRWVITDGTTMYEPAYDTFSSATIAALTVSTSATFSGATIADLGTVTTADINGGTIDATAIGGSTPAAGAFTTLSASGAFSLSGDQVQVSEGGTGSSTASGARSNLGLDDMATQASSSVAITGGTIDGVTITGGSISGATVDASTLDSLDSTQFLRSDTADTKTSGTTTYNDNVSLAFGDSQDTTLTHTGTDFSLSNDTGDIYIDNLKTSGVGKLRCRDSGGTIRECITYGGSAGAATLYYNDSDRVQTTSSGVTIYGTLTVTG